MQEYPVPIRFLNDFLYCPRRCALHGVEGLWEANAYTIAGELAHDIADTPGYRQYLDTTGHARRIERAIPLCSRTFGLVGKADIVEFHFNPAGGPDIPLPVDYKLGKRRKWDNDDAQLCAQALCLEEMLAVSVPTGAIYHVATRRRREVVFDEPLRALMRQTIADVRELLTSGYVPPAHLRPQCEGCSMHALCLPELTQNPNTLDRHHAALFITEVAHG